MLLRIGFFLLIERKLIGLIQFRYGPNKVFFLGLVQFVVDLVKLVVKERIYLFIAKVDYFVVLIVVLFLSLLFWTLISFNYFVFRSDRFLLLLMLLMIVKMLMLRFFLLIHKSVYVQVRFIRVIVQFISYDILIILIIIFFVLLVYNFGLIGIISVQGFLALVYINFYLFIFWVISLIMEILRLPFDFYESESELISGFNLELGSFKFIVLFMVEYLDMVYFLNLRVVIFFYCHYVFLFRLLILLVVLWVRTLVIRYRYDKMLSLI